MPYDEIITFNYLLPYTIYHYQQDQALALQTYHDAKSRLDQMIHTENARTASHGRYTPKSQNPMQPTWPAHRHAIYKTEKARRRSSTTMIGLVLEV